MVLYGTSKAGFWNIDFDAARTHDYLIELIISLSGHGKTKTLQVQYQKQKLLLTPIRIICFLQHKDDLSFISAASSDAKVYTNRLNIRRFYFVRIKTKSPSE